MNCLQTVCVYCQRLFSETSSLKRHLNSVHFKMRYSCDVCGKTYSQVAHVTRHKKMAHWWWWVKRECWCAVIPCRMTSTDICGVPSATSRRLYTAWPWPFFVCRSFWASCHLLTWCLSSSWFHASFLLSIVRRNINMSGMEVRSYRSCLWISVR